MRQNGIARLAEALEPWSAQVKLQPGDHADQPVRTGAADRRPATLQVPCIEQRSSHNLLGIDTQPLVDAIKEYLELPAEERS